MDPNNQPNTNQPAIVAPKPPKGKFPVKVVLIVLSVLVFLIAAFWAINKYILKGGGLGRGNEVVWWGLWEDESVVAPLIAEYQEKNPKVKIKYIGQSKEDYRERLTNALAKGNGPDIFRFHNSWIPMFKSELDKVPETVFSASDFSQIFYTVSTSDLTWDSSLLGIPLEYDGLALYINEEIFEKNGKQYPNTWNELRQLAKELTIKSDKNVITQSGVALGRTENVDHWQEILALMMLQNGVNLNKPTGKLAEDALRYFTLFSSVDGVWNETLPASTVAFSQGRVAMYFGPSWRAFEIRLQNPNLRFKTIPLPQLPKTEAKEPNVTYASYWVEGVWSGSNKKEAAWDFLKFLSTKESLEKFYNNASKLRMFGEPYPRTDMSDILKGHPILGSIISGAINSQSWYLQSRTFDGPTGINTQINKYFEDAINSVNDRGDPEKVLETVSQGVTQVLSQYGLRTQ